MDITPPVTTGDVQVDLPAPHSHQHAAWTAWCEDHRLDPALPILLSPRHFNDLTEFSTDFVKRQLCHSVSDYACQAWLFQPLSVVSSRRSRTSLLPVQ